MSCTSTPKTRSAIIIGGGIGGLCAAIALQKIGIEAQVYEQAAEIRDLGAGLAIWPNALKALDRFGIGDAIRAMAVADLNAGSILTSRGRILSSVAMQDMLTNFGESIVVVHRAELHALLSKALAPGTLRLSSRCMGYSQTPDDASVHFADGTHASASMLIGADGLRSVIRQQLAPEGQIRYSGYTAWRSVIAFDHSWVQHWGEFWGTGRRFGVTPVTNNRVYWFCTQNVPEGESRNADPEARKAHLLKLFKGWAEPIPALLTQTPAESILSNDISDLAPLSRWTDGRVALLGDAAHAMTPNMGQGACQAMEDAVVLGQSLANNADIPTALRAYEQARMAHTRQIVSMSRSIGAVGQWGNLLACSARNVALRLVPASLRMNSLKSTLTFSL